jgi:exopolysaccharide biosynthesis polyprenyl glycosylphosphotransferase
MALKLALFEAAATAAVVHVALLWWSARHGAAAEGAPAAVQAATLAACVLSAFYYCGLYDLRIAHRLGRFAERLPGAFGLALLLLVGLYVVAPSAKLPQPAFLASALFIPLLLLSLRGIAYALLATRPFVERVIVVGACPLAAKLVAELETRHDHALSLAGVVDEGAGTGEPPFHCRHLGGIEQLEAIVDAVEPDRIVVAMASKRGRLPVDLLLELRTRGILVEDGVELYERLTGKLAIEALTPSSLVFCRELCASRLHLALNRSLSAALAAVGLLLSAPLCALIGLFVRLDSEGPVFFVQQRVGLGGRRFNLIKFRTMRPAPATTSEWVVDNGERITRVGGWLRRFRLDELPQLWNVLRGDMNLVGPRPHPVSNYELFCARIPYYRLRCTIRPGITGWAQVRYLYANNLEQETEKMRYDLYYVKHLSPWLDLRILLDTVKIVLLGEEQDALAPKGASTAVRRALAGRQV